MRISKETNIGFSVLFIIILLLVVYGKMSWWNLFNPPILYLTMCIMLRETKKQASARRKTGYYKWDELSEDAKATFKKLEEQLSKK